MYKNKNKSLKRYAKKRMSKLMLVKQPELKFYDTNNVGQFVGTSFMQYCLNIPVQGTTALTRVGQNILVKSIYSRGSITLGVAPSVATAGQQMRILVYVDKESRGATPSTTDVLQTSSYISPLAIVQQGRFQVLHDQQLAVDPNGNNTVPFKFYLKTNVKTKFSANAGAAADVYANAIWIAFISNDNGGAGVSPTIDHYTRIRFSDV